MEDSWVTGATGVSAAGALHRERAAAVVILPIARAINEDWLSQPVHHPYRAAMRELYDIERWPREPVERGWARL